MSATAPATAVSTLSEPNLVKMDTTTMEEVNNNFQENGQILNSDKISVLNSLNSKSNNVTQDNLVSDYNKTNSVEDVTSANSNGGLLQTETSSIYCLNETLRLTVTYPEEWLCVARMPLDFTKAEFENLLKEYGPVSQSLLIHSETSGKFIEIFFELRIRDKSNLIEIFPMFLTFLSSFFGIFLMWFSFCTFPKIKM